MKEYRVLNIMDTSMEGTDQRVAVIELAELERQTFNLPSGLQPYTFGTDGKRFVIDFNSSLTQSIIQSAQNEEIVTLDLDEFREREEIKNGNFEKIYYHRSVRLIGVDEEVKTRKVDFNVLCNNCRTDRRFNVPLGLPAEMYLGLNQFKEILRQMDIECFYCGQKGYAGDETKFELVSTKGLDEDLTPQISTHEKRQWYYDLDFIFQHYLKNIFDINEYENTGFAVDFYESRFILKRQFEVKQKETRLGFYMTGAIALHNGQNKTVEDKFPFMYKIDLDKNLPEQLIINPKNYSAEEKPIKTKEGGTHYFPLLELKNENAT